MEMASFPRTLVRIYQTKRCHIPEAYNLHESSSPVNLRMLLGILTHSKLISLNIK